MASADALSPLRYATLRRLLRAKALRYCHAADDAADVDCHAITCRADYVTYADERHADAA